MEDDVTQAKVLPSSLTLPSSLILSYPLLSSYPPSETNMKISHRPSRIASHELQSQHLSPTSKRRQEDVNKRVSSADHNNEQRAEWVSP